MNTPSKEALDAAENVQDYWGFPRRATIDLATIIDRHFEPLRAEMVQLTVDRDNWKIRAEEMDGYKADCMELRQRAEQAEASNSELRESHAAIYLALATLEADCSKWPDQIRALRAANAAQYARGHDDARAEYSKQIEGLRAELADWVSATNAQRDRAEKAQAANAELAGALLDIGGSPERDKDFSIGETKLRLRARFALAHLAAGEPEEQQFTVLPDADEEEEAAGEPAKHPDTEGSK